MAIPDYQSLMLPVLQVAAKAETSVPFAETEIATKFELSNAEREQMLPSGKQRVLHNRVHWAKFYLTKAGLLESPKRGRFTITPAGQRVLANPPATLDTKFLLTIPSFRDFYRAGEESQVVATPADVNPQSATPEEVVEAAYKAVHTALKADLLERILQNSPSFFEQVIIELLVAMGYGGSHRNASEQLGRTGDGGVDGVINEDVLGLDRVYIQAKRYAPGSAVGRPEIQAFTGSLVGLGASKGVFVTTSTFSAQAVEFVSRIPQRVVLIDGRRLTDLMLEHGVGVRSSRLLEFKRLDEDFFAEE
ncbi:restriction endonuclease protein Mrr 2 [Rhizobium sp. CIAT894]|uniref:restriction endonuclease n=1 Tax=Rhizobium sp. CIAT894 TaxID=2020312 RepID=UPI000A1F83F0|nr:restriction endonuclease [Rhizobium sp. CIAT894]ARM88125.1 restriction endonuclease protein Mrr 2 [Rhizobium sp. CIAT894]